MFNNLKYIGVISMIIIVFAFLNSKHTEYINMQNELVKFEELKKSNSILHQELLNYKNQIVEINNELKKAISGKEQIKHSYDSLLNKNEKHNYEKINKNKKRMAEKIYEKSINDYYNGFYDCKLCIKRQ